MVLKEAFLHKGYALVDVFQPCVTFNKINTYEWFKENTYQLDSNHEKNDLPKAMQKALETNPMPIGIFYQSDKLTFEEHIWGNEKKALVTLTHDIIKLQELFDSY
jgi:2-oxoglutarate ferredoxin oxidoreductase subunit beta